MTIDTGGLDRQRPGHHRDGARQRGFGGPVGRAMATEWPRAPAQHRPQDDRRNDSDVGGNGLEMRSLGYSERALPDAVPNGREPLLEGQR
jgi:hypothetical protein